MKIDIVTIIGLLAAFCTTVSFLPQAIKTIHTKDTEGISLSMYFLFTLGTFLWLLYGLFSYNIPIIIANGITLFLQELFSFIKLFINRSMNIV
ncbi:MAG: SemiSWEET transporter [Ferruginibacter sp.]